MKAVYSYLIVPLLACSALLAVQACGGKLDGREVPAKIENLSLGYVSDEVDLAATGLVDEDKVADGYFVSFPSAAMLAESAEATGWDSVVGSAGRIPVGREDFVLRVKTMPENAMVEGVEVTSSDGSVIRVLRTEGKEVHICTYDVGDCNLHVVVHGKLNTVEADFPVRVITPVEIEFYINSFWDEAVYTRLKARARKLPGNNTIITAIQDSVTVCGYCEWYDFRHSGSKMLVSRDTIRMPMESPYALVSTGWKTYIRNITDPIREFRWYRKIHGSRIVVNDEGKQEIVDHDYSYVIEQVILDFNIFADQPYYEFYFYTKNDRSTEVVVEDEETGDESIEDGGADEDEDFDPDNDGKELTKEEKAYFVIRYNDFLSDEERTKQSARLRGMIEGLGYDENMSDLDKKALVEELNNTTQEND